MTLIEVQVALLILLVGVLTAVGLAPMGMKGVDLAEKSTAVTQCARHLMETTCAKPYALQPWTQFSASSTRLYLTGNAARASGNPALWYYFPGIPTDPIYSFRVDVKSLDPDKDDMHRVQVTVYRQKQASDTPEEIYRLVSYRAKYS